MMHIKQASKGLAGPGQGQGENGAGYLAFGLIWFGCFGFMYLCAFYSFDMTAQRRRRYISN
jgi:hypothetical protein